MLPAVQGGSQKIAQHLDVGENAARPLEAALRDARDDLGQGSLATPRRAEENDAVEAIRLDGTPQEFSRAKDVILADDLIQGARAHPRCERLPLPALLLGGVLLKQVHHIIGAQQENAPPLS